MPNAGRSTDPTPAATAADRIPTVLAPPATTVRALTRLAATGATKVRLDPRAGAIGLSAHDAEIGLWRALAVPVTNGGEAFAGQPSVAVPLEPFRQAVRRRGADASVALQLRDRGVGVHDVFIAGEDDGPAPPESADTVPIELPLPEGGPSVASVRDETRLIMDPALVARFRDERARDPRAFTVAGRWYVSASTGDGDITSDPRLTTEVASYAEGSE